MLIMSFLNQTECEFQLGVNPGHEVSHRLCHFVMRGHPTPFQREAARRQAMRRKAKRPARILRRMNALFISQSTFFIKVLSIVLFVVSAVLRCPPAPVLLPRQDAG